jgi:hypothetical protein
MTPVERKARACSDIARKLGFDASPELRAQISFAVDAACFAVRLSELSFLVRKAVRLSDARLVLRSELVRELRRAGHDQPAKMVKDQPTTADDIVFCALQGTAAPRLSVLRIGDLRATPTVVVVDTVAQPARSRRL